MVSGAHSLITNHRQYKPYTLPGGYELAFTSMGAWNLKEKSEKSYINCYSCGKMVHYANKFPEKEEAAADNIEAAIINSEDGGSGGNFTFAMIGEEKPYPYK